MKTLALISAIFLPCLCLADTDYGPALDAVKRAAMIQTGVQAKLDMTTHYFENEGKRYAEQLGVDGILGSAAYSYKVYREQACSVPIRRDTRLTVRIGGVDVTWTYHF